MPAYNCSSTVRESIDSILNGNLGPDDELVIFEDASRDSTYGVIQSHIEGKENIHLFKHNHNKGGGATRNDAVEMASNDYIFCLDSDNVLAPNSVGALFEHSKAMHADVVSFQELRYFTNTWNATTHTWCFEDVSYDLPYILSHNKVPGASGNYLFTKDSWSRARGYPEFSGALDTWGFGLAQVASGSKMVILPGTHYYHRYGHESYWVRHSKSQNVSRSALQLLIPYLDMIEPKDIDYIMGAGRDQWFSNLDKRPLSLISSTRSKQSTILRDILERSFGVTNVILNKMRT